ncbi:MAG: hypothetical protein WA842_06565 [Croceibacterium sp.]
MDREPIIAIGLLTKVHLRMLGSSLKQVFPVEQDNRFDALIAALDEADRQRSGDN